MTRSSDLVMVEREVLANAVSELKNLLAMCEGEVPSLLEDHFSYPKIVDAIEAGERALQSVEGGVRVAAKQESCPESAPRTETEILTALEMALEWIDAVPLNVQLPAMPGFDRDWVNQVVDSASADHDAGNLRSLAEPNQPHALSQGWRDDMENAPKEDPNCPGRHFEIMVAGGKYFTTADDWRTRYDHPGWSLAYWDGDGWCGEADEQYGTNYYYEPTHWMLKVAPPPSPENTPRDSSESTTGGAS